MTNFLSALAATVATTLHANALVGEGWSFPYPPDFLPEPVEDPHFLVSCDGRRVDIMVRGDARDTTYYRPGQPGYAEHKAIAIRQGMEATGLSDPVAWERQELADLTRRSNRVS